MSILPARLREQPRQVLFDGQTIKCTQSVRRARQDVKSQHLTLMQHTSAGVFLPDLTIESNCAKNRWAGRNRSDKSS